jgi:ribonucleoside-diphosphate reductase alpha chain
MQVIKRDQTKENISFDKILKRINELSQDLKFIDAVLIAKETISCLYDGIKTSELDKLSSEICAAKGHHHPEYNTLGGRLLSSNNIKNTPNNFFECVKALYDKKIISDEFYEFVFTNKDELEKMIVYERDLLFDFFAMKTLERSYLLKINDKIIEKVQFLWMRVAIQIHAFVEQENILEKIKETYDLMSTLYFTHATPTIFNSGSNNSQLSSCFLFSCEDNLEDIFKMISDIGKISKWAGGIGISLSNIRAKGSLIRGTNGKSEGIIPLCKTIEMVGRYINQGGKRQGSIAVYLEPWHSDIYDFIELRKNTGDENLRARDLFIAMWVCDLFMKRVQNDQDWTLMCPDECPGLVDSYGEEFEKLYLQYEEEKRGKKVVKARDLWNHILENQIETGMPYISYKDTVNRKNMQKQLGVIRNSNLCVAPETMILTSKGYFRIDSLENKVVDVWNGQEFTETTVHKTGENQELVKVVLSNGSELECTPYHKFYIKDLDKQPRIVEANYLLKDDELIDYELPVIDEYNMISKNSVPVNADAETKLKWLKHNLDKEGYIDNSDNKRTFRPNINSDSE